MSRNALTNIWSGDGRLRREPYAAALLVLFGVMYGTHALAASALFGRSWRPIDYVNPDHLANLIDLDERMFLGTLVLFAAPFIWIGTMLTLKRLRAAALPPDLAWLLFVPVANLVLVILLCLMPSRRYDEDGEGDADGEHPVARPGLAAVIGALVPSRAAPAAVLAIVLTALLGVAMTALSVYGFDLYGGSLFFSMPVVLGLFASLLFGFHGPRAMTASIGVGQLANAMFAGLLLVTATEGVICLAMAAPLWVPMTLVGSVAGHLIAQGLHETVSRLHSLAVVLALGPVLLGAEWFGGADAPMMAVRTSVLVDASPEQVWPNVVAFPALDEPDEWLFRRGIAYPTHAWIEGEGEDAVRYCVFTTGPFVEPIEVWDEPYLLRFAVTHNPPPMREWSLYEHVHPPHLDGFLASEHGQFRLERLPDGRTRLEGTTWYRQRMWPQAYWQLWSDAIIHRIHGRVLEHVKTLSEQPQPTGEMR
ncbi:MAG: hypothetical protein WD534_10105 [Phycisphaeraceae bacterium]